MRREEGQKAAVRARGVGRSTGGGRGSEGLRGSRGVRLPLLVRLEPCRLEAELKEETEDLSGTGGGGRAQRGKMDRARETEKLE